MKYQTLGTIEGYRTFGIVGSQPKRRFVLAVLFISKLPDLDLQEVRFLEKSTFYNDKNVLFILF